MIYRFYIVSDEVDNFKREISIDADDNFLSLRNAILDSVGYTRDQIDSFFICDDDWSKRQEITIMDMGTDSDDEIWIMDETPISELIEDDGQKLIFVFDYISDRAFFMEMKESTPGKNLTEPLLQTSTGKAPAQLMDIDLVTEKAKPAKKAAVASEFDDLDSDFYGDESYNDDEFEAAGFDDFNFDEE